MPTPDELRAACERLRRIKNGEALAEVYDHWDAVQRAYIADLQITSGAYLAEHDPQKLTLDVLRRKDVLGEPRGADVYWEGCGWHCEFDRLRGEWVVNCQEVTTLGQLRRAIELAEGV